MRTSLCRRHEKRTRPWGSPERELDGGDVAQVGSDLCPQKGEGKSRARISVLYRNTGAEISLSISKINIYTDIQLFKAFQRENV